MRRLSLLLPLLLLSFSPPPNPSLEAFNFRRTAAVSLCTKKPYALLPPLLQAPPPKKDPRGASKLCLYLGGQKEVLTFLSQGFRLYPKLFLRTFFFSGFRLQLTRKGGKKEFTPLPIKEAPSSKTPLPDPLPFVSLCELEHSPLFLRYKFAKKKRLRFKLAACLKGGVPPSPRLLEVVGEEKLSPPPRAEHSALSKTSSP